jgi:methionyl-tRNA formyltransferase
MVLTRPDRPSGRGLAATASPVKRAALSLGLPLLQPVTLKDTATQTALARLQLDTLVVAAYGLILPRAVLALPRHGCINIHASLLPRWRGAAPIARAIEAGDPLSGITLMQMDEGLDTGAIIDLRSVPVDPRETSGTLHDKLAALGAAALVAALGALERDGRLACRPQPAAGASYAAKIVSEDALIRWERSPAELDRRIRAMSPLPGAVAAWQGTAVKLWTAYPVDGVAAEGEPGTIVAVGTAGIDVACGPASGRALLRLVEVQPAAGRRMGAAAYAAGRRIVPGRRFGEIAAPARNTAR